MQVTFRAHIACGWIVLLELLLLVLLLFCGFTPLLLLTMARLPGTELRGGVANDGTWRRCLCIYRRTCAGMDRGIADPRSVACIAWGMSVRYNQLFGNQFRQNGIVINTLESRESRSTLAPNQVI